MSSDDEFERVRRLRGEVRSLLLSSQTRAQRVARTSRRDGPSRSALRDLVHAHYEFGEANALLASYPGAWGSELRKTELELEEATHLFAAAVGLDED
jgi:hypothetical protein